jgi:ribonucleoside-diphosphate reductase alpha chain
MTTLSRERDQLLTDFGKATLNDRYLLPGESYQEAFARVASAYAEDEAHAQRMYDNISKLWFIPATPVMSNGGTDRGLPISCYLNNVDDSMQSISDKWTENVWLGAGGGGIGTCWSDVRSIGEPVKGRGGSSGIIPFIRILDSQVLAVSQGSLRRGAAAVYLDVSHPEIEEFLEIRKPSGDFNRKSLNLHHGIVLTDAFMEAVRDNLSWELVDPHSNQVKKTVSARNIWQKILEIRLQTGEPYLLFKDNATRGMAEHQRQLGMEVKQSNLCCEIMLHTGLDQHGKDRTAVCCLGSVNLEKWYEWKDDPQFIQDCLLFLDNVLQDYIDRTEGMQGFEAARYAASQERSVGLGVMGLHSLFQQRNIPFDCAIAKSMNMSIFKKLREDCDAANEAIGTLKGACPDAAQVGKNLRFSHCMAIAPTASISIIGGGASPCVEPWNTNIFTQKTLSGSFEVRNKYLEQLLESVGENTESVWDSILEEHGSVQHLPFLTQEQKDVFKTAWEIDQRWVVDFAADRTPHIDQGQSINLFLKGNVDKWDLHMLHYTAWKSGVKSLYYLRSMSTQRAGFVGGVEKDNTIEREQVLAHATGRSDYEECLACQ